MQVVALIILLCFVENVGEMLGQRQDNVRNMLRLGGKMTALLWGKHPQDNRTTRGTGWPNAFIRPCIWLAFCTDFATIRCERCLNNVYILLLPSLCGCMHLACIWFAFCTDFTTIRHIKHYINIYKSLLPSLWDV